MIISEYVSENYKIGNHVYCCEIDMCLQYGVEWGINNGRIWKLTIFDLSDPPYHMLAEYRSGWIVSPINSEVKQLCDSLIEKYNYYNPILRDCNH